MAQYNFVGDVDNVPDSQLQFIHKVIVERGFENSKVTFAPVGKPGDNYVANVKRITVEGEHDNLSMIAKLAPTNDLARKLMNADLMFKNEHIMYFDVLPTLVQLQKDAGIPEEEQLKYAKCYGSFAEPPNEVILLEDLKPLDYTMLDRFVSLDDSCVRSVLKNFALLHSLSYVLQQKKPELFENFKSNLTDMMSMLASVPEMKMFYQTLEDQTLEILDVPDHMNIVKHKISGCLDMTQKLAEMDCSNKYAVILQGDAWTNNIMFRYENDTVAESIMIDYQMSRYGSPVSDIMYFIFNCTDHETRKKHYHDWIDFYHSELDKSLSNFNLKADLAYPREKLDDDLKRYGDAMLGLCICLASMLIRKSEDAAKMMEAMDTMDTMNIENMMDQAQELGVSNLDTKSRNCFKDRVTGLIDSFSAFGLI